MTLRQYLIHNIGKVARIGCKRGSGFIFADRIGLNLPKRVMEKAEREVISVSPSAFGGDIVLIDGTDIGYECDSLIKGDPALATIPDQLYFDFADTLCYHVIQDLWIEMVKTRTASYRARREDAWNSVDEYRHIILSPRFAILSKADGEDILRLLERRFEKTFGEEFWEGREDEE